MTSTTNTSVSPLSVAKNRWDEATRMTEAYLLQKAIRTRRAWERHGQAGELQAWADVAEAEAQLVAAEAIEVKAAQDVAWLEHQKREAQRRRGR